jgi:hypothetical protein
MHGGTYPCNRSASPRNTSACVGADDQSQLVSDGQAHSGNDENCQAHAQQVDGAPFRPVKPKLPMESSPAPSVNASPVPDTVSKSPQPQSARCQPLCARAAPGSISAGDMGTLQPSSPLFMQPDNPQQAAAAQSATVSSAAGGSGGPTVSPLGLGGKLEFPTGPLPATPITPRLLSELRPSAAMTLTAAGSAHDGAAETGSEFHFQHLVQRPHGTTPSTQQVAPARGKAPQPVQMNHNLAYQMEVVSPESAGVRKQIRHALGAPSPVLKSPEPKTVASAGSPAKSAAPAKSPARGSPSTWTVKEKINQHEARANGLKDKTQTCGTLWPCHQCAVTSCRPS